MTGGKSSRLLDIVIMVLALAMAAYQLIATQYMLQDPFRHQDTHLMFSLVLVLLAGLKMGRRLVTLILLVLGLASTLYFWIFIPDLQMRYGFPIPVDLVFGAILIIVVLEASRRVVGPIFAIMGVGLIIYGFIGYYLPPPFHMGRVSVRDMISILSTNLTGIFGTVLMVSANYIFLFLLLGGLITVSSASRFFNNFGLLIGQRLKSGAAVTSVAGATLVGTVTGAPGPNTAIMGSFTIPMMKDAGYKGEQAGAIVAASSTGSSFMPPVMGAAAFVMAGLTGIPYVKIIVASFLPALLYFVTVGIYCHLQALKMNIKPLGIKANKRELLTTSPGFLIPFAVILVLFLNGFSPAYVGFWAVVSSTILAFIIKPRPSLRDLVGGFSRGATMGANVGVACAAVGIIARIVEVSGLGVRLGSIVLDVSGGVPLIALLVVAAITLILGTALPTTPAYILAGMLSAPVLVKMGYSMMQAHLFVLYSACMAPVTPPVAEAAIVASRIAGVSYTKTMNESMKPSIGGWLVPFVFMWVPLLILQPEQLNLFQVLAVIDSVMMLLSSQIAFVGYYFLPCTVLERVLAIVVLPAVFLGIFTGSYVVLLVVVALFAIITISQLRRRQFIRLETVMEGGGGRDRAQT